MPLSAAQLPASVVDFGNEIYDDVSNEAPRMDRLIDRARQCEVLVVQATSRKGFDRAAPPLKDKVVYALLTRDFPSPLKPQRPSP